MEGRRSILHILIESIRQIRVLFAVTVSLLKYRPDVIHTHSPHYHIIASILGPILGIKVIWHWHGSYFLNGLPNFLLKSLVGRANQCLCISQFVKNTLPRCIQKVSKVVYNGIEIHDGQISPEKSFRCKFNIPDDTLLVGAFGSIFPLKGFGYFIEAIPEILKKHPNSHFALIGGVVSEESKLELERLISIIENLGIKDRIILTGKIPHASKYMAEFDVIVAPNIPKPGEGFGLAVVESMAAGTPPVVTLCGAFPEIVENGVSGLLVTPQSSKAIAEGVIKLLSDDKYRKRLGDVARQHVEKHFKISRVIDDIYNIYQEI